MTEEFVSDLKENVGKFFFDPETRTGLYYKERIEDRITESFAEELKKIPDEGLSRENGKWWLYPPVFITKQRQRIFWMTQLKLEAKLFKYQYSESRQTDPLASLLVPSGWATYSSKQPAASLLPEKQGFSTGSLKLKELLDSLPPEKQYRPIGDTKLKELLGGLTPEKQEVSSGESKFEVHWSVNITQNKKLTSARVEKIECLGTKWRDQ